MLPLEGIIVAASHVRMQDKAYGKAPTKFQDGKIATRGSLYGFQRARTLRPKQISGQDMCDHAGEDTYQRPILFSMTQCFL